jgi:hypothetical protein
VSSAASASACWVELGGRAAVASAELEAPLSGRRCLLYRVALGPLQRLLGGGRGQEVAGLSFLLRSEGQLVLVEPADARLRLAWRRRLRLVLGYDATCDARLTSLYRRLERHPPAVVVGREQRLDAGDWVEVAGWLEEQPHACGQPQGYRLPPRLPVIQAARLIVRR